MKIEWEDSPPSFLYALIVHDMEGKCRFGVRYIKTSSARCILFRFLEKHVRRRHLSNVLFPRLCHIILPILISVVTLVKRTQANAPHLDTHLRISMDEMVAGCLCLYGFATVQQPADQAALVFGTNLSAASNGAVIRKEIACAEALTRAFPPDSIHVFEPTRTWSEWKSDTVAANANPRSARARIYRSQTTYRMGFGDLDFMRHVAKKLDDHKGVEILELHWLLSREAIRFLEFEVAQSAMKDAGRRAEVLARRAGLSFAPLRMTDLEWRANGDILPASWKDAENDAGGRYLDMEPRMFQFNAIVKGNFIIW